ncbi:hypothetical protein, partial [Pseudomonas aeruginosa]|uniref:hypothetical protein n=1 Tax=Pseudomonas aeruginosa TaxID=287 RepID=UPI001CDB9631
LRLDELGDLQHMTQALVLDDGTLVYLAIGTGKSAAVNARQDAVEEGAARTDAGRYRRRPG